MTSSLAAADGGHDLIIQPPLEEILIGVRQVLVFGDQVSHLRKGRCHESFSVSRSVGYKIRHGIRHTFLAIKKGRLSNERSPVILTTRG